MKLVNDIVDLLADSSVGLEAALLKAQVLAHKFGERELGVWVGMELRGYSDDAAVPDYRVVTVTPRADLTDGYRIMQGYALPLAGLDPERRRRLVTKDTRQSITAVEGWVDKSNITVHYTPASYGALKMGINKSYEILRAWGEVGPGVFRQITVEVRSRLLGMMMELSDRLPSDPPEDSIKQLSRDLGVADLFRGAVLKGNQTITIAVGNQNTVTSTVTKNNWPSLAQELRSHSVPEADIGELQAAIDADGESAEHAEGRYGARVRQWFGGMLSKAGTTAWDVSTNTAAGILAAAIAKYYGLS